MPQREALAGVAMRLLQRLSVRREFILRAPSGR